MALVGFLPVAAAAAPADKSEFRVPPAAGAVLKQHCVSCHDEATSKGGVRLDNLPSYPLEARLDLLNRVVEQVFLGEMPPKKEARPTETERETLVAWLSSELRLHNASKLDDKLRTPEYGNVVDHDKLFSGKYKDLPGFTPDRRWLISDFIFEAKFNRLLEYTPQRDIDGKRQSVIGDNNRGGMRVNLTDPFLLPTHSGVRYYDTTALDGGHLLTM
jgi:mono/diheme cytochrome c family protein